MSVMLKFRFKGIFKHFGKYTYFHFEKIDIALTAARAVTIS